VDGSDLSHGVAAGGCPFKGGSASDTQEYRIVRCSFAEICRKNLLGDSTLFAERATMVKRAFWGTYSCPGLNTESGRFCGRENILESRCCLARRFTFRNVGSGDRAFALKGCPSSITRTLAVGRRRLGVWLRAAPVVCGQISEGPVLRGAPIRSLINLCWRSGSLESQRQNC